MTAQHYKTTVGAFLLGGLLLLLLGVIALGGGRWFANDREYVLYFDGSVSGLATGAPVVFRGVPMGSVTRINMVADPRESNVTIPVYVRIDEKSFVRAGGRRRQNQLNEQTILRRMIQHGLRARLQIQSLITGQYRVELDLFPNAPAHFRSNRPDMEIPTIPSPIDTLQSTLARLPLEQMVNELNVVLTRLSAGLADNRLGKALDTFTATFDDAHKAIQDVRSRSETAFSKLITASTALERDLPPTLTTFREAMQSMAVAADQLRTTTASAQRLLGRDSPVLLDFRRLLKDCSDAVRALRALATMLERNPEALLKGRHGSR